MVKSFPYVSNNNSKVLILGTMPGIRSLDLNQYYGHKMNQFWKIICKLFDTPLPQIYKDRIKLLKAHNIALWDVLQHCKREGSADSAIKEEFPNDFDSFLKTHSNIKHVFFNGKKAAEFYKKHVGFKDNIKYHTLPSTSPANASISYEEKLKSWKIVKNALTTSY